MLPSREFTWKSAKRVSRRDVHTVLNSQVLVLNRLWQAVNICTARRAFALVYAGHAQIVSSDEANNFMAHDFESWRDLSADAPDHEVVTTISFKIRIPRVIVLLVFDRLPKKEVKFTRHNVFERDKNTCQYCGQVFDRSERNLDHVVPRDQVGITTFAAGEWQVVKVSGHDYLTVDNISQFYEVPAGVAPAGDKMELETKKHSLEFVSGSREAMINGARSWLCFPLVEQDGKYLVS